MAEKYYIMPTARMCHGTEKANSKDEALARFMERIGGDLSKLVTADTGFGKTKGIHGYHPPQNDFEVFMNCAIESLRGTPNPLYNMNGPAHRMNGEDTDLLFDLQSAYESAKRNHPDMGELPRLYKETAKMSLSVEISEYELPKIALVADEWKEGGATALLSENVPFDLYDDGRVLCLPKDTETIRKALKKVGIHTRKAR